MLMGTHIAKFLKKHIHNCHVTFAINDGAMLTTAEKDRTGIMQMAEILILQDCIDTVGVVTNGAVHYLLGHQPPDDPVMKIIRQYEWYSDLGMARSMFTDYFQMGFGDYNTETKFWFGRHVDRSKDKIRVATLGPTDWNKKWGNDEGRKKVLAYIESKGVELIQFGRDIKEQRYLHALQQLQDCHLYFGPAGSLGHAAAGTGMDTVVLCEVFPAQWLSPEFYKQSGYHKSIVAESQNHCKTYKCISNKPFEIEKSQSGWGNPPVEFGAFWVQTCKYMPSGKSCIASVTTEQLIKAFDEWFEKRGMAIQS
jgi:hypothetical protein